MSERLLRLGWYSVLGLLVLELLWLVLPLPDTLVERYYTSGLFAIVIAPLVRVQQLVPVSLTTVVGAAAIGATLAGGVIAIAIARHRRIRWRLIGWVGFKFAVTAIVLFNGWAMVTFGVGYRRAPIESRLGLAEGDTVTRADLEKTLGDMVVIVRESLQNPEERDETGALDAVHVAMGDLVAEWDGHRPPLPPGVKRLPDGFLVFFGAYGINSPLLMEPHVDAALPAHAVVSTGAHELAHVAGFSGEADATLAGLIAGLRTNHPFARYASALSAFASLLAELSMEEQRTWVDQLPPEALNDLRAEAEVYKRYTRNVTHSVFQPVYHSYLVTQGVSEGIEDYSRGSRLFVNAWQSGLANPDNAS